MKVRELIKSKSELEKIASILFDEVKGMNRVVSRYTRLAFKSANFMNGKKYSNEVTNSNLNKENMGKGIYNSHSLINDDLFEHNFKELSVARDMNPKRFNLELKGYKLPVEEKIFFERIPPNIDFYDKEFEKFTKEHKNTRILRQLRVDQRVIVNSNGGKAIQSIPFFSIYLYCGYSPIPLERNMCAVCNSKEDISNFTSLIKYLPDPTSDKKITMSKKISEAFHNIYSISGLKLGSLEDAGIPLSNLYDIVILNGIPIHEIFGHHFEESIRFLNFGESATFKFNQKLKINKKILMKDSPYQKVGKFKVFGFTYFDSYGRERESREHIKDGKVVGFLGSEYVDNTNIKKFLNIKKSESKGNAYQHVDGFFPQPRMTCTVMNGPEEKFDLEGKILLVPSEGSTHQQEKTYTIKSFECYVLKNGKPERVIPLQVTGGINQALSNLTFIKGNNYNSSFCYKSDPIGLTSESIALVSQFTKNQVWKKQQVYPLNIPDNHLKILIKQSDM